jgi:hypothetical protein
VDKKHLQALSRQDSFGFDSPNFQRLFGRTGAVGVDKEDDIVFSDIDLSDSSTLSPSPVGKNSGSTKRVKKQKKKKSKRSKHQDEDTSRPDSDRNAFLKLQEAKAHYRKLKNHHPSGNFLSTENDIMPTSTRRRTELEMACGLEAGAADLGKVPKKKKPAKDQSSKKPPADSENVPANGQESESARVSESENGKNSSPKQGTKRKEPPAAAANDDVDEEMRAEVDEIMKTENKLPVNKRGQRIQELHGQMYYLKQKLKHMTRIAEEYKGENVKSKKTIAKLEKILAKSETVTQDAAAILKTNQELLKACKEMTKTKLWRYRKFIADPEDEAKAAEFVLTQLNLPEMERKNARASLIKTYKSQIKKALYGHKSYVAQEFKKAAFKILEKDDGKLLNPEQIKKCITRDIKTEDDMAAFQWYWEVLLAKMIGAKEWDSSVRYYNTISQARDSENDKERLVSISDEAMCLLLWENCYERWLTEHTWDQDDDNKGKTKPKWAGKYTNSNLGQQQWGGWKPEGYEAFNTYFLLVKAARKDPNSLKVEKSCLQILRLKHNITQKSRTLQEHENRRIKRAIANNKPLPVGLPIPLDHQNIRPVIEVDSDEEDDDDSRDDTNESETD